MRICLNMIVKNEAAIIERALASVADVISAAVICDTGSADDTVERILRFCASRAIPCELHRIPFPDFAQARNQALEFARGSSLSFDHLLLMDADMILRVRDKAALDHFAAEAALLTQMASHLAYRNIRILRRDAEAHYIGATHEALSVNGTVEPIDGWVIIDLADGANRPEKLVRDERLLRQTLDADPGDSRACYYLASTLRDAGRHQEAAEYYQARVALGGWQEEAWHARYQRALCLRALGDQSGFVAGCLEAYDARPWRAEPLLCLADHLARIGLHDAALLFAERADSIPYPEQDRLFVERTAYDDVLRTRLSVSGYYSRQPGQRERGHQACEALAVDPQIPVDRRQSARANLFYYAEALSVLCPSARAHALKIDLPAPFLPTNPSFVATSEGYLGIVRGVNYRLSDGRYQIDDNHGRVRTRNFLVRLGPELELLSWHEMAAPAGWKTVPEAWILGFEDCRLFRWQNGWWCSATARDSEPDGRAVMVLLQIDQQGHFAQAWPLRGYADDQHQKNWMPCADDRLRYVYRCGPATVIDASSADGHIVVTACDDPGAALDHWSGGTPLLAWGQGYLGLIHEAKNSPGGRQYLHRFVAFDADLKPLSASQAFLFQAIGVEFATGLTYVPERTHLLISYGVNDGAAWLVRVAVDEVARSLKEIRPRLENQLD
jgi:glycosyltransferase involved in cell wall biosynthesis